MAFYRLAQATDLCEHPAVIDRLATAGVVEPLGAVLGDNLVEVCDTADGAVVQRFEIRGLVTEG